MGGYNLNLGGEVAEGGEVIISFEKLKALIMQKFMPIFPFNVTKIHQLRGKLRLNLQKFAHAVGFF